jgi:Cu2+-exporting ATPase
MRVHDAVGDENALAVAAAVEQYADHPVADAIEAHADPADVDVAEFEREPGRGVSAQVTDDNGDRTVLVGRRALFAERDWQIPDDYADRAAAAREGGDVPVLVGWDGRVRAVLVAGDSPREEWREVVAALATDRRVVVLTGDDTAATEQFRDHPGVDEVYAGVPPEGKTEVVRRLADAETVAMVGDGVNDAPALAAADIGVALDHTALAADAADAVVTTDDLAAVPYAFDLTAATNRRIRQNLGWACCYNAIAVPLAVAGALNPLFAAAAMATSSLLVVANSSRRLVDRGDDVVGGARRENTEKRDTALAREVVDA